MRGVGQWVGGNERGGVSGWVEMRGMGGNGSQHKRAHSLHHTPYTSPLTPYLLHHIPYPLLCISLVPGSLPILLTLVVGSQLLQLSLLALLVCQQFILVLRLQLLHLWVHTAASVTRTTAPKNRSSFNIERAIKGVHNVNITTRRKRTTNMTN